MRNTTQWYADLKDDLDHKKLYEVELGLYLLSDLVHNATADSLWVLLTGYEHSFSECQIWTKNQKRMLAVARHLLSKYHTLLLWEEALNYYREIAADIRGYEIEEDFNFRRRTNITVANDRFDVYQKTLCESVEFFIRKPVPWATAGRYKCEVNQKKETVTITPQLANLPRPPQHNLNGTRERNTLEIPWHELQTTAEWMDRQREKKRLEPVWGKSFRRVKLQIFNDSQELVEADFLTLNETKHLVGIPSAGKSVLMKVLTVWAHQKGLHTTLVVADVLQIFDLIKMFAEIGITDGVCPSHQKERDLVEASIWIATPGSLVYSRVPRTINRENILYFELVARRSNLVIFDEVDQHQAYLDIAFSPNQTLCRPARDAWLNKLHDHVEAKLKSARSRLLQNEMVSDWWDACRIATGVADKIYHLLS